MAQSSGALVQCEEQVGVDRSSVLGSTETFALVAVSVRMFSWLSGTDLSTGSLFSGWGRDHRCEQRPQRRSTLRTSLVVIVV